jgi:hypothetical protein
MSRRPRGRSADDCGPTIGDLLAQGVKRYCSSCYKPLRANASRCQCGGRAADLRTGTLVNAPEAAPFRAVEPGVVFKRRRGKQ